MIEEWRPVVGWEGLYEVSSLGRVRSIDRVVLNSKGVKSFIRGKLTAQTPLKNGYLVVKLCKNNRSYCLYTHRLVAEAFLPNTDNLPQVNHKDENKKNNCALNLEWCTRWYNLHYGTLPERTRIRGYNSRNNIQLSKPVIQYDFSGNIINRFQSLHEAERFTGIKQIEISRGCRKLDGQTTCGYIWRFEGDELTEIDREIACKKMNKKPVLQLDINGNVINEFPSATIASKAIKGSISGITNCCRGLTKTNLGYKWKYKYE